MARASSPIAFPPGPSWAMINADQPLSLPILGQFDPKIIDQKGKPMWQTKPGIAGALPWLKHVGRGLGYFTFEFNFIAMTVIDPYPLYAWNRINELAQVDESLGRPPRIWFNHGLFFVEGFITDIPDAPRVHWGGAGSLAGVNSRLVRQIGPIRITIQRIPKEPSTVSFGTNFITKTEETEFEDLARNQYGNARYSQTLSLHNQGKKIGDTLELPRKRDDVVSTSTPVAPQFDDPLDERL